MRIKLSAYGNLEDLEGADFHNIGLIVSSVPVRDITVDDQNALLHCNTNASKRPVAVI